MLWGMIFIYLLLFLLYLKFVKNQQFILQVNDNEKAIIERGRKMKICGRGVYILIPFLDKVSKLDLTPKFYDLPRIIIKTKDAKIGIDTTFGFKIKDVNKAYKNPNWQIAAVEKAKSLLVENLSNVKFSEIDVKEVENNIRDVLEKMADEHGYELLKFKVLGFVVLEKSKSKSLEQKKQKKVSKIP